MDQKFIQERKADLLIEKERLEKELSTIANKANGQYRTIFPDYGHREDDNVDEVGAYEKSLNLKQNLETSLNLIPKALDKIAKGNYGKCEKCGKLISLDRLEANPSAETCLECQ